MARSRVRVQHLIACPSVGVARAASGNPYTLRDVGYYFDVPADREWPVRLGDLWLYVRFFDGRGSRDFAIEVWWHDAPGGAVLVCEFDPLAVQFPPGDAVHSRVWRVAAVRYPGPGRYEFRLRRSGRPRVLAAEFLNIRMVP